MAEVKESTRKIWNYVISMDGHRITAADIADATGIPVKSVNGSLTAFQKKGLIKRIPAEIELEDGTHKPTKIIELTDEGRVYDIDAPTEKKAE